MELSIRNILALFCLFYCFNHLFYCFGRLFYCFDHLSYCFDCIFYRFKRLSYCFDRVSHCFNSCTPCSRPSCATGSPQTLCRWVRLVCCGCRPYAPLSTSLCRWSTPRPPSPWRSSRRARAPFKLLRTVSAKDCVSTQYCFNPVLIKKINEH